MPLLPDTGTLHEILTVFQLHGIGIFADQCRGVFFLADKQQLIRDVTIYSVRDRFADTGRFRAFEFDWTEGSDIPKPHFFWDSDIAKWLESAAYLLQKAPNDELQSQVESVILGVPGATPHYELVVSRTKTLDELEIRVEVTPVIVPPLMVTVGSPT